MSLSNRRRKNASAMKMLGAQIGALRRAAGLTSANLPHVSASTTRRSRPSSRADDH
ncbi:hypothetical protein [Streptomyces sp. NPDC003006]